MNLKISFPADLLFTKAYFRNRCSDQRYFLDYYAVSLLMNVENSFNP